MNFMFEYENGYGIWFGTNVVGGRWYTIKRIYDGRYTPYVKLNEIIENLPLNWHFV